MNFGDAMLRYRGIGESTSPCRQMTVPVEKVSDLHSVLTMVGGKAVYGEGPFPALEAK